MIDRAATIEKFGYDPNTLSMGSGRWVVATCDRCGEIRDLHKGSYRDLCHSCSNKIRFENPKTKKKQSIAQKKRFEDLEEREKISVLKKKYYEDPEARKKNRAAQKKYHKDHPEAGEKHSELMKKRYEDSKEHEKSRSAAKKYWKDPEARKKQSTAKKKHFEDHPETRDKMIAAKKKHYEDHPETREKISAAKNKYWKDPEARERHSAAIQGIPYDEWEAFAKEQKYCPAFNEACRESNREKYGRRCFICDLPESENITKDGKQKKLSVHHVDMNKNQGCDGHEWKLVPLCMNHHSHGVVWTERIKYLLRIVCVK